MFRILVAILGLAGFASATTAYPFPYQADYPSGIRAAVSSATIQKHFVAWKGNYYVENGDKARILWGDPAAPASGCVSDPADCTVSEGIGYGMLIMVYMDNATNGTQPLFDKLWNYYNANLDGNGLMNWLIGANGVKKTGAATDGDLDVALALSMAYKQWGDSKYLTGAQSLMGKIWDKEVGSNVFKPDDQGTGNLFNPSYFSVGAARVFGSVDKNHNWASVADGCLSRLATIQSKYPNTGLIPDWVDGNNSAHDNNGSGTTKFGYDAVRTPWRVVLDYIWFGTSSAQSFESKILAWIKGAATTPYGIKMEYKLDGTTSVSSTNSVYLGGLVLPAMVSANDTGWVHQGTTRLGALGTDNVSYYNDSWKVLYLLTLSGNFQNMWGTVKPANGIVASPSWAHSDWSALVRRNAVELRGAGTVSAQLVDLSGRILSQATGTGSVGLSRPAGAGVWLVRILGEQPRTFPVVAD